MAEYRITAEVHDEAAEADCKDVQTFHSHWKIAASVRTDADSVKEALEWAVKTGAIADG
jgi:hypothetical protein